MIVKTYHVTGMSCKGCATSVETIIKAMPGVVRAVVDLHGKSVSVDFQDEPSFESLKEAVRSIGYDLSETQISKKTI